MTDILDIKMQTEITHQNQNAGNFLYKLAYKEEICDLVIKGSHTAEVNSIVMGRNQQVYFLYDAPSTPTAEGSPTQPARSPRCEAFLMTGDKMLNLNPKISPCYAKVCFSHINY